MGMGTEAGLITEGFKYEIEIESLNDNDDGVRWFE